MELNANRISALGATSIKGINNTAALELSPIVASLRAAGHKNKDLAAIFEEAGTKVSSSVTIVSDLRAVGEYLSAYPEHIEGLAAAPQGKQWRDYLCAARRGHRLQKKTLEGEAYSVLLAKAGVKTHKVATAYSFKKEHADELASIEALLAEKFGKVAEVAEVTAEATETIPLEALPVETAAEEAAPVEVVAEEAQETVAVEAVAEESTTEVVVVDVLDDAAIEAAVEAVQEAIAEATPVAEEVVATPKKAKRSHSKKVVAEA